MKTKLLGVVAALALLGVVSPAYSFTSFLYDGTSFTTLDNVPGSNDTIWRDINNSGQIVGDYSTNNGRSGVLYSGGNFTTLNVPTGGGNFTVATGINNSGQIVGTSSGNNGLFGYLYSAGSYTTNLLNNPTGINDLGQIIINGVGGNVLYSGGNYTALNLAPPGSVGGVSANGINNAGDIIGSFRNGDGNSSGFLYSGGNYTILNDPLGTNTLALGLNNSGQIIGVYWTGDVPNNLLDFQGFLYSQGIYITIEFSDHNTYPMGINDAGQIIGIIGNTPLPSTLPLFATGLGALGLLGWRKKRKAV